MKPATPQPIASCCALIPPPILNAEYPRPNAGRLRRLMAFAELTPDTAAELAGISRRSVASYMDDNDPAESLLFSYSVECQAVAVVNRSTPLIDPDKEKRAQKILEQRGVYEQKNPIHP